MFTILNAAFQELLSVGQEFFDRQQQDVDRRPRGHHHLRARQEHRRHLHRAGTNTIKLFLLLINGKMCDLRCSVSFQVDIFAPTILLGPV